MASSSNKRIQRKQWILFTVIAGGLMAVAIVAGAVFDTSSKKSAAIEKPTTKPLSVGVSQTDRDAASLQGAGEIAALRKLMDESRVDRDNDKKWLEQRFAAMDVEKKNAAEKAANKSLSPPAEPAEGFTGNNPFQQNGGVPPQPVLRSPNGVGASPVRGQDTNSSMLETVPIGTQTAQQGRTGIALLDGMANQAANSSQEFGRRQQDERESRGGFNRTADDDPLSPNRASGRNAETYIPAGTYIRAVILNGLDAPTGGQSQQNPHPVLLQLSDDAVLPNKFRAALKNCMVTANGYGDVAAERAYIRTDRLSCIDEDGGAVDVSLKGYITGEDGKTGMRGRVVEKTGRIMANAMYAAVGSGIGQAFKAQGTTQTTNALGGVTEQVTDGFRAGFGSGVSKAFDKLTDYYIKVAERMFPVVEIGGGRVVDIVVSRGVSIERGTKHKNTDNNTN